MATYTVKLKDGTIFTGKRNLMSKLAEPFGIKYFDIIASKELPTQKQIQVPNSSILYAIPDKKVDGKFEVGTIIFWCVVFVGLVIYALAEYVSKGA